ncbi:MULTISPECIES: hypothetical protein [unclassified Acidovorax]|uniref:hypothetical protein n=1 Tax=unclassified Acidovorax TaxID=2684926 RepID=UPI001C456CC6|nr:MULTISPECIES: hypothetical protein [unclassified Acidovorax]MBV7460634.1 hypothetical protein [Acidovorax sp. sif0632]MBV7465659.1 hypothetical protein [Acidovorax sp. sif0613]
MSDRLLLEIASAAQRWRSSQKARLAAGRHLRQLSKEGKGLGGVLSPWRPVMRDAYAAVTRAKQVERKALRALAKLCDLQATSRGEVEDVLTVDEVRALPRLDVVE